MLPIGAAARTSCSTAVKAPLIRQYAVYFSISTRPISSPCVENSRAPDESRGRSTILTTFRRENLSLLPVHYDADFYTLNWAPDGSVLAMAGLMRSSLWRFTPGAK